MEELFRLEHVHFRYEEKYPALKDVSLSFSRGERIAVLGKNGAGKSTLFLCCNGVLRPQSGKILLGGREITDAKKDISFLRQSVGLVFQEPDSQIIAGTVENEVSFGPMNLRLAEGEVRSRVGRSLGRMNLEGYQARAPQYLSGGEKKRVSIADILAMEPEMILFDEPTASLDPENAAVLEETLEALHRAGVTLIISTHDVDFAYRFAERGVVFCEGEIIADAGMEEIFASEAVLLRAGLKKPLLYAAAELLDERFGGGRGTRKPRRIEEFRDYVDGLR